MAKVCILYGKSEVRFCRRLHIHVCVPYQLEGLLMSVVSLQEVIQVFPLDPELLLLLQPISTLLYDKRNKRINYLYIVGIQSKWLKIY